MKENLWQQLPNMNLSVLSEFELKVLATACLVAERQDWQSPSNKNIAKELGVSRNSVSRARQTISQKITLLKAGW